MNQNSSLLPYLDQWLEESCSSAPCSNATLTGALDQVLGNCSDDFDSHNITAEDVAHWFQVYPLAREIACLKTSEPFNGTLPNITSNTTWQNAGGVPSSSAVGGAGAGTGASATHSASSASSATGSATSSAYGTQQSASPSQDDPNSPENSGDNNWGPYGGNSGEEDGSNSGNTGAQGDQNTQGATPSGATGGSFVVAADNDGAQGDQNTQGAGAGSNSGNTGAQGEEDSQGVSSSVGGAPTSSAVGGVQSGAQSQSGVQSGSSAVGAATPTSSTGSTSTGGVGGVTAPGNSTMGNSTTSANSTGNSSYCLTSLGKELSAYMGSNLTFPYLEILLLGGNETAQHKLSNIPPEALCQECVFAAFDLIEQSSPFLADTIVNKTTNQTLVGWLNATCANATEKWQPSTNGTLPEGITATTFNSTYGFNVTYFNETTGNWTTKTPQNVTVPIGQGSKYLNETDSEGSEEDGSDSGSSGTGVVGGGSGGNSGDSGDEGDHDVNPTGGDEDPYSRPGSGTYTGVSAGNSATPTGGAGAGSTSSDPAITSGSAPPASGASGASGATGTSGASATPTGSASTDPAISSASAPPAASSSGSGENTGAEGDQNTQGAGNENDNSNSNSNSNDNNNQNSDSNSNSNSNSNDNSNSNENNNNNSNDNSGDGGNTGAQGEQNTQGAPPVKRAGRFAAHQLRAEE